MLSVLIVTILISSFLSTLGAILGNPFGKAVQSTGWFDFDSYNATKEYCIDITDKAKRGGCHDFFTREDKIENLIDILNLGEKSNPFIVGSPGVGKKALVEGLAYRIANGTVDKSMLHKRILKIDVDRLVVGKGYGRSDNALNRLRAVLEGAKSDKDIILFVDELSQISKIQGGIQLVKTYINRGDIKIIASVTDEEFSYLAKENDLNENCTYMFLEEPNKFDTFRILKCLKDGIEKKYGLIISDDILMSTVEMTGTYMKSKFYPHKAIDVLNLAVVNAKKASRDEGEQLELDDVVGAISELTNIPIGDLSDDESEALNTMNERMKKVIIGQDEAVDVVCNAVKSGRLGICSENKPRASFLFAGPNGVGKSEMAKVLGEELGSFINIDILNYGSKNSLDNLISVRAGRHKSELIEKITKNPYSVVMFDNIDKANEDVLNVISGILDRGFLIDSNGSKVDFTNAVIIMTADIGKDASGMINKDIETVPRPDAVREHIAKQLDKNIARKVGHIVIFNYLGEEHYMSIARIKLSHLESKLNSKGINLKVSDEVIKKICDLTAEHEGVHGGRKIEKQICESVQNPVSDLIIRKEINRGDTVDCVLEGGKIKFNVEKSL